MTTRISTPPGSSAPTGTPTRRTALLGAAGVGAIGTGLLLAPSAQAQGAPQAAPALVRAATTARTLRRGMSGADVKAMQGKLWGLHYWMPGVDGVFGYGTLQAVWAFQKAQGLARTGTWGPAEVAAVARAKTPTMRYKNSYRIEVNKARQLLLVGWGGSTARWVFNTSTGANKRFFAWGRWYSGSTPTGTWKIYRRNTSGWVTGALGSMYKPYYVVGGIAIHGSGDIPAYNASHGCCRLLPSAQDFLIRSSFLYPNRVVSIY
ncbi:L,D-transpeptidase family protein [Branchiibius sp. NY16-3462-2]|uniref:L,D-transpeptidase family protein n=1 Tax=Branchiibius sp. NY16-3462-2 TaxID=1807500 RepID=UPI0007979357|nr:L,D-transpeptidase family protein [Branchiibius sp. NY16-3462-2]KYH45965.1 hypothetical protein AZH51_09890 [Branchiibius sp. NY16-3462-2]